MADFFHYFGIFCDIVLMSLFIWHSNFRTKKINQEIHAINVRTKNCPYKKEIKRVK